MNRIAVALAALVCVACSKTREEYVNVIPADAPLVVSAHLMNLGEKASLKDYKGLMEMGLAQLSKENAELSDQLKAVVENPAETGLALDAPAYLFCTKDFVSNPENSVAFLMKVNDAEKTKSVIQSLSYALMKEMDMSGEMEWTEENDRLWLALPTASAVVTPELLLVAPNRAMIEKLLSQEAGNSFADTEEYARMQEMEGDMKMLVLSDALIDNLEQMDNSREISQLYDKMSEAFGFDVRATSSVIGLDFLNGKVLLRARNYNDTVAEFEEMMEKMMRPMDGAYLKAMPAKPAFWMGMNINGQALMDFIGKLVQVMPGAASAELEQIRPVIESIDGELAVGINDVNPSGHVTMPDFTAFIGVKDRTIETMLQAVSGLVPGLSCGMADDNLLYITTNDEVAANPGKPLPASVASAAWADEVDGSLFYYVLDAEPIRTICSYSCSSNEMEQIAPVLDACEYMDVRVKNWEESEMTLWLRDKNTNALKQLIQLGVRMAM